MNYLYVNEQEIAEIPEGIEKLFPHLIVLVVDSCPLRTFKNLKNSRQLQIVGLSYNQLETLPSDGFMGMNGLIELYLEGNEIRKIETEAFHDLINLKKIILSKNSLQVLTDDLFKTNRKLEEIDFYQNKIATIPDETFTSLPNLLKLGLRSNTCVDENFPHSSTLERLLQKISQNCRDPCRDLREELEIARQRVRELERQLVNK